MTEETDVDRRIREAAELAAQEARRDEQQKAERNALTEALNRLRDEWREGHTQLIQRFNDFSQDFISLRARVERLESAARDRETQFLRIVTHTRMPTWDDETLDCLKPAIEEFRDRKRRSSRIDSKVLVYGGIIAAVFLTLLQIYITYRESTGRLK